MNHVRGVCAGDMPPKPDKTMTNDKTDLLPHQVARLSGSKLATYLNERSKYDVKLVSAKGSPRRYRVSYDRHKVWLQERLEPVDHHVHLGRRRAAGRRVRAGSAPATR